MNPEHLPGINKLAPATTHLVAAAIALVWALRCGDEQEIMAAFRHATRLGGGGARGLRALVLLLAAMVPDDESPSQLLGWRHDPDGYLRLREQGLSRVDAIDTIQLTRGI